MPENCAAKASIYRMEVIKTSKQEIPVKYPAAFVNSSFLLNKVGMYRQPILIYTKYLIPPYLKRNKT